MVAMLVSVCMHVYVYVCGLHITSEVQGHLSKMFRLNVRRMLDFITKSKCIILSKNGVFNQKHLEMRPQEADWSNSKSTFYQILAKGYYTEDAKI